MDTPVTIFLDPAETIDLGLLLLVYAPTGVIYKHQCGGTACFQHSGEGFLIPVAGQKIAAPFIPTGREFVAFFEQHRLPYTGDRWPDEAVRELAALVAEVAVWYGRPDGSDYGDALALDTSRLAELTEAWIPVTTDYGPAVLLFDNSD